MEHSGFIEGFLNLGSSIILFYLGFLWIPNRLLSLTFFSMNKSELWFTLSFGTFIVCYMYGIGIKWLSKVAFIAVIPNVHETQCWGCNSFLCKLTGVKLTLDAHIDLIIIEYYWMTMGARKEGLTLNIPKDGSNSGIPTEDPLRQTSIDGEPRTLSDPTIQSAKVDHSSLLAK